MRNNFIGYVIADNPLELKTQLQYGNNLYLRIRFGPSGVSNNLHAGNAKGDGTTEIWIYYRDLSHIGVIPCSPQEGFVLNDHNFITSTDDRIWKFTFEKEAGPRLIVHMNTVEVANIVMSDTTCVDDDWRQYWYHMDLVNIRLYDDDASVLYRTSPG